MPKVKMGFKVDRLKARKDPANLRKGKRGKEAATVANLNSGPAAAARPKMIKFNTEQMKEYITGFHIRKNQRRMFAIKKAKDDHRKQVNAERKDRRESRRQTYNRLSQFPINEEFRLEMPGAEGGSEGEDDVDVDRATYKGANEDTTVDVEVEELDLSTGFTAPAARRRLPDSDSEGDSEGATAPAPLTSSLFSNSAAFPSTAPAKVRLIRKKK